MQQSPPAPPLTSAHLIELEPELCRVLSGVLPFASHSLHFPTTDVPTAPRWIARERAVVLPLRREEALLGVFVARGVNGHTVRRLMPLLPKLVELCLDNIALLRQNRLDALTGLALPYVLLQRLCTDVDAVRTALPPAPENPQHADTAHLPPHPAADKEDAPMYRACAGLVYVHWYNRRTIAAQYGHMFSDTLLQALSQALRQCVGQEALAARAADDAFAVLLPAGTPVSCHALAQKILHCLRYIALLHPTSQKNVHAACSAGYALYPQDIETRHYRLATTEQARMLLEKARLAAAVAQERADANPTDADAALMGYGHIVLSGGIVKKILPLGNVRTNLGRQMGVNPGMRFAVSRSAGDAQYVGELLVQQVDETHSVGEMLHMADPACPPQEGDTLRLIPASSPLFEDASENDTAHGILPHGEFLRQLHKETQKRGHFSLIVARVADAHQCLAEGQEPLYLLHQLYTELSQGKADTLPLLVGRYGENSLAFLLPHSDVSLLFLENLCHKANREHLDITIGVASYPYLRYHKDEILDCCRKALDLGLLLPVPRMGVFGSLALTISADKRYAQGDVFGAVDEYKLALLADTDNTLAWNSLGTCMAALARHAQARRYFLQALKRAPEDPTTLYNLGNICQTLGTARAAARYYRKCVNVAPEHYYAHIRLGQMAEKSGRTRQANAYYGLAAALEDAATEKARKAATSDQPAPPTVRNSVKMPEQGTGHHAPAGSGAARRYMARLALRRRKQADARELLHEVLLRDPQDAAALAMLAQIYLDSNEDPSVAEMLARKCVALMPEHRPFRVLLARALRALGKEKEAQQAER